MSWFPQIGAGSVAQFPLHRLQKWRTIANELESGERILLPDSSSGQIEWRLSYKDLTDAEAAKIHDLHVASRGSFGVFGFIDPLANLLGWTGDLARVDWQAGLLTKSPGAADPEGNQTAWTLLNSSPGDQTLSQTIGIPGDYTAGFSAWLRSGSDSAIALKRDGEQITAAVGPTWRRLLVSGAGAPGAASSTVSIVLAPGQTVDVWGLQLEAQPYASQYKPALAASGIYAETYFEADELTMTRTGAGLTAAEITLISRV